MPRITRRVFLSATGLSLFGESGMDATLRDGIARRKIPAVSAAVATEKSTMYAGAFGTRDSSGVKVRTDSIFQIASMTKAITTVAVLQLVEQGKVRLEEPVARHLPQLEHLEVLEGFDAAGKPKFRAARIPVTLHHLLTHTSGFCYDVWDGDMFKYASSNPPANPSGVQPLMFEPGRRWQYGQGLDWAGRLVEAVSGATLEEYFQQHILGPLEMKDTSYILPEAKFDRLVTLYRRTDGGELRQDERKPPARAKSFSGGGGLFSTTADYVRFMQMILKTGQGPNGIRILQPKSVRSMMVNQIGALTAGKMKSFRPNISSDVDMQPGHSEKWSFGFLLNTTAYEGGRSAGSLAWAGLDNTFYWIDPKRRRCGVILMQFLPFVDREAVGMLNDFERAAYRMSSRSI